MTGKKRNPKEYYNEELGDRPMTEKEMDMVDEINEYYEKLWDKFREEHGDES